MSVLSAVFQALLLGGLGAWLTYAFTNPLGQNWETKDYLFVAAVMVAALYHRLSTMRYEKLACAALDKKASRGSSPSCVVVMC